MDEWVECSNRMPVIDYNKPLYAHYVRVIACSEKGYCLELKYKSNGYAKTEKGKLPRWEFPDGRLADMKITYWMPLPKPPKVNQ